MYERSRNLLAVSAIIVLSFSVVTIIVPFSEESDAAYVPADTLIYDSVTGVVFKTLDASGNVAISPGSVAGHDNASLTGDLVVPSSFTYSGMSYHVKGVIDGGFVGSKITSLVLPAGMYTSSTFDSNKLYGMDEITSLVISTDRMAFTWPFMSSCPKLQSVSFSNASYKLNNIHPYSMFSGDSSLTTFGNTNGVVDVTVMEYNPLGFNMADMFKGCTGIREMVVPSTWGSDMGSNPPDFNELTRLTTVHIKGDTLESQQVFRNVSAIPLTTVYLEGTSVAPNAFKDDTRIETVYLTSTVDSVGDNAFKGCSSLSSIIIECNGCEDIRGDNSFATSNPSVTKIFYAGTFNYPESESNGDGINHYIRTNKTGYFDVWFKDTGINVESVEHNHSILLPEPAIPSDAAFDGWYSDASCTQYIGPAGGVYTPTANVTLYAYIRETPNYDLEYTYILDGKESERSAIEAITSKLILLDNLSYGCQGYVVVVPDLSHRAVVSSTSAFITHNPGGIFGVLARDGVTSIKIMIEFWTLYEGIGDFRIISMTDDGRGAIMHLSGFSEAGLMAGSVHFSGVYYKDIGYGDSKIRAYGNINDSSLELQNSVSEFIPLDSSGISVDEGLVVLMGHIKLTDVAASIYVIYAEYMYGTNKVMTPAMFESVGNLEGSL